jgi:hypothetical protein
MLNLTFEEKAERRRFERLRPHNYYKGRSWRVRSNRVLCDAVSISGTPEILATPFVPGTSKRIVQHDLGKGFRFWVIACNLDVNGLSQRPQLNNVIENTHAQGFQCRLVTRALRHSRRFGGSTLSGCRPLE